MGGAKVPSSAASGADVLGTFVVSDNIESHSVLLHRLVDWIGCCLDHGPYTVIHTWEPSDVLTGGRQRARY